MGKIIKIIFSVMGKINKIIFPLPRRLGNGNFNILGYRNFKILGNGMDPCVCTCVRVSDLLRVRMRVSSGTRKETSS